ncbi:lipopolysaccharide export LptBFGC system permease protein LptF [Povalibacter uvarum]|uniref:Lipopolysaccharide export LptBFGC system permease protein LptF n=1 Tax=Povalibacter uvarum TaxID=732238 RepID=A0A841HHV3_9GAMM|nr:hypothetical protein [Povalibacter uvarum]MBB6092751.1 lipopolysaccharide export LptBFGC system permease protein LptF [Povalibacter uvarum]
MEAAVTATAPATKPPTWYWVVSVIALLWMLIGVMAWTADLMTDEAALSQMSEAQRQLYESRPQWVFAIYAIAIFSGLAGAIGLLMRKSWSSTAFAISLVAIIVQFGYTFGPMKAVQVLGAAAAVPFPLVIFLLGVLWLWLARHARKAGWIS